MQRLGEIFEAGKMWKGWTDLLQKLYYYLLLETQLKWTPSLKCVVGRKEIHTCVCVCVYGWRERWIEGLLEEGFLQLITHKDS